MGSYGATFSIVHLFKHYIIIEVVSKYIMNSNITDIRPVPEIGFSFFGYLEAGMILESAEKWIFIGAPLHQVCQKFRVPLLTISGLVLNENV